MKYFILGYNQEKLIENRLDIKDALILRTFADFYESCVKNKNYKECGKPYVKNNMLPKEMIDILGDKISYILSCNCHETYHERQLEKMEIFFQNNI